MTLDLFAEKLSGLDYRPEFIREEEERDLLRRLSALDVSPFRFQGWLGKRKTRSFGWRYDFDDSSFTPAEPIPGWLEPLRERAAVLAGVDPADIHHALVARYDPGAGIGWHKDRDVFEKVVGVSLNTAAVLRFRQRTKSGFRRVPIGVEPRSAYLLSGEARWQWEHRITPGNDLRFSITFRTLSDKGRRIAAVQRIS
ncbi:MAG TPA: alpha-ketoglutarate-dependent dioxygenase AlkB [Sphingomicrobium sp.]|nr:alpha-ketoglutarate-dependent dioxygenase AlkB [Sphingomicrobium sp.]